MLWNTFPSIESCIQCNGMRHCFELHKKRMNSGSNGLMDSYQLQLEATQLEKKGFGMNKITSQSKLFFWKDEHLF